VSVPVPFVARLAAFGARPAVVTEDLRIGYAELAARVAERAARLGAGRRLVMIRGANDVECLVTYLAALHAGHVAWLVPDEPTAPRVAPLVTAYGPDVIVSGEGARVRIDERRDGSAHDLHPDLALLLGTSGSTGTPRLVRLSHGNLQSNAEAIARYLGIDDSERAITSLPMHYCYGLSVVHSHLARGAALLLTERSVADERFWSLARGEGATSFAGVPHTFDLLERVGFEDMEPASLRYVTQAGGRLAPDRVRRFAELGARRGWRLVVMYGQTEATARMAYLPPHLAATDPGAIGVPIPGGSFEIRPVPEADEPGVGEIVYRGPNVMLGYADAPADLALGQVVDELATGDLGRRRACGLYEVVGRRSRFLKLFGLRIDLQEVERALERSGTRAVCAGTDGQLVVAVAGDDDPGEVGRRVAELVGVPVRRVRVDRYDEIPRLPSGKPDYAAVSRGPAVEAATAPDGVAAAFCEVLGRTDVGADDSFSALGGDSLSYVEMSLALEQVLGQVPPGWPQMTVRELARLERRRPRLARVETNVTLRAAAISLVVASHMTAFWPAGGAHLLLAIAGHNFARFQLAAGEAPRRLARSAASIARIAVPTSAYVAMLILLTGGSSVGAMLLVNNYAGAQARTDGRWHYWYLEALVQILIVLTALFAIPAVRRLERRRPFAFVLVLLGVALVVRFDLVTIGGAYNAMFRPHAVVWLFLLGWAAHRATTTARRVVVSAAVLACVPGFFGETARETIIACGLLALLWLPVVVMPRSVSRVVGIVAAASLYVYLTHWQVWPHLVEVLPFALALPLTVAAGVAAWLAAERLAGLARRAWAARAALRPAAALRRYSVGVSSMARRRRTSWESTTAKTSAPP
jgi:acyl-CoA synthetase (AMP-forming)/AMP-acid ligase II